MIKKVVTIAVMAAIIFIGLWKKDLFLSIVEEGGNLSVMVSMLLVFICVFFPVVPFPVLGGLIAAVFGLVEGALISLAGVMVGTVLMFLLARYGFRDFAQAQLVKYPKAKEYEAMFENNSFLSILLVRVIPLVPAPVINIVCGLSGVSLMTYIVATFIGKLPNIIVVSFAGSTVGENKWLSFGAYGLYFIIITSVAGTIYYRQLVKKHAGSQ